jgi:hypothetical protein
MDPIRFDALTRVVVGEASSRRRLLRLTDGALFTGALALSGFVDTAGKGKNKKQKKKRNRKKKRTKCKQGERRCGAVCVRDGACCPNERVCSGLCIPETDCCVDGARIARGGTYRQCGVCDNGALRASDLRCDEIDPDLCNRCREGSQCTPADDGTICAVEGACGICKGGLCERGGAKTCNTGGCCPLGMECCRGLICCPPDKFCQNGECRAPTCPPDTEPCGRGCCGPAFTCCPELTGPPVCRLLNTTGCGPCEFKCGDSCCNYQSFNSCCVDKEGKAHCSTIGSTC